MHTTIEAIIETDGQIRALESVSLTKPTRALITILEDEVEAKGRDFSTLISSLEEFPPDFMADGREQPDMPEREPLF
ncbi:AbrB/MazE/SpoVT family DNA-binding domain-containing protein [Endothiovibrio diazotrophicus]